MVKPVLYIEYEKTPYVIEKPGTEVYRINNDGSQVLITDRKRVSRILERNTVISEAEALIMAYSRVSPDEPHMVQIEEKIPPGKPFSTGIWWKLKTLIQPSFVVTVGTLTLLIVAAASFKSNLGFIARVLLVVAVLPPLVYFITFLCVAAFLLYRLARFVIATLQQE